MDSRNYSSFIDLVRGNINLEDEIFDVSESSALLVEDSPVNDEAATSKKKQARGVNFSVEEDKLLVAAWLNTSVDPVYGNEQHKTTFYGKVAKYFMDQKTDSTRSVASLTTRWGTINRETVKFVGSLAKIEAKNESGTTAHDKIEKAKELFKEIHGSVFQFEHCWLILKDYPKWASTMPRGDSRKEMPQTPDLIDQGVGVDGIMDFERPIGRKAEKAN
uniref:No apical meristem-associated C-terminal domain-containing protein n=2 Tax=Quercus lobata TaxID=97700 RepID=A0A7N2RAT5_QUELO